MVVRKLWCCLVFIVFCDFCVGWLDERPVLESISGNLYIISAKDKNITLKTSGNGNINVNDVNLLNTLTAAQTATRIIEKWKLGILDDIEINLQRLSRIIEGPNGLLRKINLIEFNGDATINTSSIIRPPQDSEGGVTTAQVRTINNRLRRLENKVRSINTKLRTNECASNPCQNGGTCMDRYNAFYCHCPPEWEGSVCTVDVNECERLAGKPLGCQNGATCINLPGTYSCTCPTGWYGFHCATQKSACDIANNGELCGNGVCLKTNTPLGYTCICNAGWEHLGENNPACLKDINECTTGRYPCSQNPMVACVNTAGSFRCGACPAGYTGDGFKCEDVDECLVNNGGCSMTPFVECINTPGSRNCGLCPNGWDGDGIVCSHVGSCSINNGGCHNLATCREGPNSVTICLCPSGYQGTGRGPRGCQEAVNACRTNPCHHGTCNAVGLYNYSCSCDPGWSGVNCAKASQPCSPNPCKNNGTCRVQPSGRAVCDCTPSFSGPTCSTPRSSCGKYFRTLSGYIEFPEGGNTYDHGLSCAWVIITNHTLVLNLTFTRFAMEAPSSTHECVNDYIQIHDGRSAGSQIIGRYCGHRLPNNGTIISSHNALYIWFHSDSTINDAGIAFNWTSIAPICGGDLNEEYGSLSSPGFPGKYPPNRDCYWNINVPYGKRIILHFISLAIETHPTCNFDYLEVNETNYIGPRQIGLYCNHSQPAPLTTYGSRATIHFHSDNSGSDVGFHLSYMSIPGAPDCGGVFTSESGEIASPGYHSGIYRPNMICEWEIRLPENSRIRLTWLDFDVESSRNCIMDSVQVYQGPDINSPLVEKYCGNTVPAPLTIDSNRILIRFESDINVQEKGFVVTYEVECGGIFTEPNGTLTSPYYPNNYPATKDCVYLISQPPGKAIMLQFEFMDIEEGNTVNNETQCYFDRLEIRDGDTENSTLLQTLCGPSSEMPADPIYSTHNFMHIEFFTDSSVHNRGFKLNYTTIDRECGGIYRTAPGTLDIPGPVEKYLNNVNCLWTIRAPKDNAIQLTWSAFPARQNSIRDECGRNHIELIEDYGSPSPKSLGKYCQIKSIPQIMTTQGNDLTIHYSFSGDIADAAYQVTYVFLNDSHSCGGHYFAETGTLRTPNYPERYPKNKQCTWVIEAKNKFLVTAYFRKFELENSTSCLYDHVEIRSGGNENAPLLGRYCGTRIPQVITSMTNQMFIKFVSDTSLNKNGFEMSWHTTKSGCGGNLRTSSGEVISPNYPQNYNHRAICAWNIRVAAGSVIRITFIDFEVEDHAKCTFDYLEISDVVNGYTQNSQRFCGPQSPPFLISKSNQLKLIFRSDVLTSFRGFHLKYVTECNNELTGFGGVIESPNFPQNYENLSNCTWVITVPPGNKINITFSHFNIRPHTNNTCPKDYLRIQEGDGYKPNTELLKKCGFEDDVLPLKISSTQRQVFLTFISDRFITSGGFRLEWYVDGCNKHFTKPYGRFTSPGYPEGDKLTYPVVECEWLIEAQLDESIEITFAKVENTKSHECETDSGFIEIYNGQDVNAPKIVDKLCYSETPVVYTSTGNQMLVKFKSEIIYASHGFSAFYKVVPIKCGGRFIAQSGIIHSTNYPKNYPHNQNCEWLISVDYNHAVNLTFLDLDLEKSKNCTDDYIKIFDGSSRDAPLLGTHCQSTDQIVSYISTGNQMLVVMRTDTLVSAKGFKAEYNRTCGARIEVDSSGGISSSSTLHTLPTMNCSWILVAKDSGDKIGLTFTYLDLLESEACATNHIEVYEGEGVEGPLLGKLCSNKIPGPYYSSGNALTVHLTSSYGVTVGDKFDAIYNTYSSACGGKLEAESGIFSSPKYPLSYAADSSCIWTISNSPGNRITLTFKDFDVTSSPNCDLDYLEIRDNDGIGKLHGIYCGKNIDSITTTAQRLWVKFRSSRDTVGNPKGFQAEYKFLFGNEIVGEYGDIASPMYPRPFRKSEQYSWRVTVELGFVIRIFFTDFDMDSYDDYCYSNIKIYDGYNDEAPLLKELCGISTPKDPIISSSNLIFIEMDNYFSPSGNYFHLKWEKLAKEYTNVQSIDEMSSLNSKFIVLSEENRTYSFESPGYPEGYAENSKYSWTFESPVGTHLLLKFLKMNLEETENCIADYIAIYNGHVTTFGSDQNLIKKVCLSNATITSFSGTNLMTVQFISDGYQNKTGFSAIVFTECGGIIEKPMGVIEFNSSLNYYRQRTLVQSCEWFVKVRTGRRISVKVVENKIESSSQTKPDDNSCKSNYLMLKNGESSDSPILGIGKYCNGIKPPIQNTSSNHLYIKLAISYTSVSFKLIFREIGHDCGGRFEIGSHMDSQQEIASPNYPNIPTPHVECIWTLMSTDDNRLAIHFIDRFDLAYSENCDKEYVEIRDGSTDDSPLLGRFCRNTPPSTIITKGNIMYVHYYTDIAEPRNGFRALVTSGEVCGGIERKFRGGVITSPNFPDAYDTKNNFCSWWIIAPYKNYGIRLQFMDLELPVRRNCSTTDHVTISEKPNEHSFNDTEIGTYCGRMKPPPIDVLASEAIITFNSSFQSQRLPFTRGFRLNYTFTSDSCGGDINGLSGTFQSTGYPRTSKFNRYCSWRIIVPEGYHVVVDIIDLDLGVTKYGQGSHVSFYNDPDSVSTILQLRESAQSVSVSSSSNYMTIYYVSTEGHRGMSAKYTAVKPTPCGGYLRDLEGTITNPTQKPYDHSTYYCKWKLQPPEDFNTTNKPDWNTTLSITVTGFITGFQGQSRPTTACRSYFNYVSIKGHTNLLSKICGNLTKESITLASPYGTNFIEAQNASNALKSNFNIKYKWHKCGAVYEGAALLMEPVNVTYPVHCAFKITIKDDDTALISFFKMNLSSCDKSYILIRGRNFRSPIIGKFCGNEIPQNIITPSNEVLIEYFAMEPFKFEIAVDPAKNACGGKLSGRRHEIQSPGFPQSYGKNMECIWEITASSGYHVGLTFKDRFNLETSNDCTNDYVEVYEWKEEIQNASNHWRSLGRACGREPPIKAFNSTNNKMKVKFVTNDKIEADGFKAVWDQNCGGVYEVTEFPKYIESPNYPGYYQSNSYCNYTLIADNEQEIIIDFSKFELEGSTASCGYDNLTINTYIGEWMRASNPFCGKDSPGKKISKGKIEVIFRSDTSVTRGGFKFKYYLNDCGGTIKEPKMINPVIQDSSDDYAFKTCVWVVEAPENKSVLMRTEALNLTQQFGGGCITNAVRVYEGNSTALNDIKATLCGDQSGHLPVLQSYSNKLTIVFDGGNYGSDPTNSVFKAAILFVNSPESGCGGQLRIPKTGTMSFKTQKGDKYEPFQDCHWLIKAPPGYNIQFEIKQMDLKNTSYVNASIAALPGCNTDYIEVRDGGPFAELIGRFCGSDPPPQVTTSEGLLWIRFVSDGSQEGAGVQGILKAVTSPCGITDLPAANETHIYTFDSPKYPEGATGPITCRWIIHGTSSSASKRLKISFADFDLPSSDKCDLEYVQIADMDNRAVISEGFGEQLIIGASRYTHEAVHISSRVPKSYYKYCGSEKPHDYYSNYKDVEVIYKKAAGAPRKKGFRLTYSKASCSRNFTGLQGRIMHEDISECYITIEVPENYTISLYFNHFFMPGKSDCSESYLQIRDGGFDGHVIQTVCGYETPPPVFSKGNKISIHALYTGSKLYYGSEYDITYTSTTRGRGCGGQLYNYGGLFTSPLYPGPFRNRSACVWDVTVPQGSKAVISFNTFDIGPKTICETDNVILQEIMPNGEEGPNSITLCGGDTPADFKASTNHIKVTYYTSVNNGGSGWIAYFAGV